MRFFLILLSLLFITNVFANGRDRGPKYEFDPGAPKESRWPDLFAQTPNYRSFGKAVIGGRGEKFRWVMGPMWYRGRLNPEEVKVFIVGQEGAQDENVSNRSFTGSTGTRMQKFLNYLGIDRSYLFMNTFVYTITGQYSLFGEDRNNPEKLESQRRLLWLAQNEDSVVVKHRHELFNYMLETNRNTLAVVIGVGTAGKDSVATWFQSHGENCTSSRLTSGECYGRKGLKGVLAIGVRHPGSASPRNGGEDARGGLRADFQKKADIVATYIQSGKIQLEPDLGMERNLKQDFKYGYASIPHRDFAFGTNWSMGDWATTSNRRGADAIQVFSANGCYNNQQYRSDLGDNRAGKCLRQNEKAPRSDLVELKYDEPKDLLGAAPEQMEAQDVPYESPKGKKLRRSYDVGPEQAFAKVLLQYFENVDWTKLGVTQDLSFGPNGLYRGRVSGAKLIVIADQFSHTDMFSGRALTGEVGQRLQSFLNATGVAEDYLILRTLPVDTSDLAPSEQLSIATNTKVVAYRNKVLDYVVPNSQVAAVLLVGKVATKLASTIEWDLPIVTLASLTNSASNVKSARSQIKKLAKLLGTNSNEHNYNGSLTIIPRMDLPMHTRWWMGTSGDRASRAYELLNGKKVFNENYYQFQAPKWAAKWKVTTKDLSSKELLSLELFKKWLNRTEE